MFFNTETILQRSYQELKVPLSFESVRKSAWRRFFGMAFIFGTAYTVFLCFSPQTGKEFIVNIVVTFIFGSYFVLIIEKFLFYVCLINYQLDFVNTVLKSLFKFNFHTLKMEIYTFDMKNVDSKSSRLILAKLLTIWEIFDKVQENATLINKSMGITMLFTLMNMIMILVNSGYIFCTVAMGDSMELFHGNQSKKLK